MVRRRVAGALLAAAAIGASFVAAAGSSSASFAVHIDVSVPGAPGLPGVPSLPGTPPSAGPTGTCISQSLSEETGAVVRVTCPGGVFVSISPQPGGRFVDTHGGAYSYYFGTSFGAINRAGVAHGSGTIAAFRVYSVGRQNDGPIDMLVSF
jgi:hypothetical protein